MGFSSWNCAEDNTSIPAYPYAKKDFVESEVVLVLPDETTISGVYDGYGRIGKLDISSFVKEDEYWKYVKLVKKYNYSGQKYGELSFSTNCKYQGYFYPDNFDPSMPEVLNGIANNQIRPEETV